MKNKSMMTIETEWYQFNKKILSGLKVLTIKP